MDEKPRIIMVRTADILGLNEDRVEYCRLNSGATRPNSHLGGIAPHRGPNTFLQANLYNHPSSSVAEVTVIDHCSLPADCFISDNPDGPWGPL